MNFKFGHLIAKVQKSLTGIKKKQTALMNWAKDKYLKETKDGASYNWNWDEIKKEGLTIDLNKDQINSVITRLKELKPWKKKAEKPLNIPTKEEAEDIVYDILKETFGEKNLSAIAMKGGKQYIVYMNPMTQKPQEIDFDVEVEKWYKKNVKAAFTKDAIKIKASLNNMVGVSRCFGGLLSAIAQYALTNLLEEDDPQIQTSKNSFDSPPSFMDTQIDVNETMPVINAVTATYPTKIIEAALNYGDFSIVCYAASREEAHEWIGRLENKMLKENQYRGKCLYAKDGHLIFHEVPVVTWDDVILTAEVKRDIRMNTVAFLGDERMAKAGVTKRGIMMYGIPGTGKTSICKAIFHELKDKGVSRIYVTAESFRRMSTGDLFNIMPYLGKVVLAFEDIDMVGTSREVSMASSGGGLLGDLLTNLDGMRSFGEQMVILASTNKMEMLDDALADRPGRFDRKIEIGLPTKENLAALYKKFSGMDVPTEIVDMSEGFTGSHVVETVNTAKILSAHDEKELMDCLEEACDIIRDNFFAGQKPGETKVAALNEVESRGIKINAELRREKGILLGNQVVLNMWEDELIRAEILDNIDDIKYLKAMAKEWMDEHSIRSDDESGIDMVAEIFADWYIWHKEHEDYLKKQATYYTMQKLFEKWRGQDKDDSEIKDILMETYHYSEEDATELIEKINNEKQSSLKKKAEKVSVTWDTDGKEIDLPKEVIIPLDTIAEYKLENENPEIITDYLSNTFGWSVDGWSFIEEKTAIKTEAKAITDYKVATDDELVERVDFLIGRSDLNPDNRDAFEDELKKIKEELKNRGIDGFEDKKITDDNFEKIAVVKEMDFKQLGLDMATGNAGTKWMAVEKENVAEFLETYGADFTDEDLEEDIGHWDETNQWKMEVGELIEEQLKKDGVEKGTDDDSNIAYAEAFAEYRDEWVFGYGKHIKEEVELLMKEKGMKSKEKKKKEDVERTKKEPYLPGMASLNVEAQQEIDLVKEIQDEIAKGTPEDEAIEDKLITIYPGIFEASKEAFDLLVKKIKLKLQPVAASLKNKTNSSHPMEVVELGNGGDIIELGAADKKKEIDKLKKRIERVRFEIDDCTDPNDKCIIDLEDELLELEDKVIKLEKTAGDSYPMQVDDTDEVIELGADDEDKPQRGEQYKTLNDAAKVDDIFKSGTTEIWYMKNFGDSMKVHEYFIDKKEDKEVELPFDKGNVKASHTLLGKISGTDLEEIFMKMQGEVWSSKGEAFDMISKADTDHTSMSVGDIIKVGDDYQIVGIEGFEKMSEIKKESFKIKFKDYSEISDYELAKEYSRLSGNWETTKNVMDIHKIDKELEKIKEEAEKRGLRKDHAFASLKKEALNIDDVDPGNKEQIKKWVQDKLDESMPEESILKVVVDNLDDDMVKYVKELLKKED